MNHPSKPPEETLHPKSNVKQLADVQAAEQGKAKRSVINDETRPDLSRNENRQQLPEFSEFRIPESESSIVNYNYSWLKLAYPDPSKKKCWQLKALAQKGYDDDDDG